MPFSLREVPVPSKRTINYVRYFIEDKAEGSSGYERSESQEGRDERDRISPFSKEEWHLPHANEINPLPGGQ